VTAPIIPHVLIAEARFFPALNDALLAGARAALDAAGATHETVTVPGALDGDELHASALLLPAATARNTPLADFALGMTTGGKGLFQDGHQLTGERGDFIPASRGPQPYGSESDDLTFRLGHRSSDCPNSNSTSGRSSDGPMTYT